MPYQSTDRTFSITGTRANGEEMKWVSIHTLHKNQLKANEMPSHERKNYKAFRIREEKMFLTYRMH